MENYDLFSIWISWSEFRFHDDFKECCSRGVVAIGGGDEEVLLALYIPRMDLEHT